MNYINQLIIWSATLALALVFVFLITACEGGVNIQVDGKDVSITAISGKAAQVHAKLEAGGKTCKGNCSFSGRVGDDGCYTIPACLLCGQQIPAQKVCQAKPGAPWTASYHVDGGGIVAIEVPVSFVAIGSWNYVSTSRMDSAKIIISDTPFGTTPLSAFIPEAGKKVVFGKFEDSFSDSIVAGTITGAYVAGNTGMDSMKFIICGSKHFFDPVTGKGVVVGTDSNYLFPEFPAVTDFGLVHVPASVPVHTVAGNWGLLTDPQATLLGLPNTATTTYIVFSPDGATPSQIDSAFILSSNGNSANGRFILSSTISGKVGLAIAFSKSQLAAVWNGHSTVPATLSGTVNTTVFRTSFNLQDSLRSTANVEEFARRVVAMTIAPNPTHGSTSITYSLAARARVDLDLVNEAGKTLLSLTYGYQEAGNHRQEIESFGKLPPGAYFVRFEVTDREGLNPVTRTEKVVLIR